MDEWESFKNCVKIQSNLDMEAWDVMLFQPLKDLSDWWSRQSSTTKAWTAWLASIGGTAFARWVGRVAGITAAEVAGLLAEALVAVIAALALGTFMDVVGRCLSQAVAKA